jgi:hypothetical protein
MVGADETDAARNQEFRSGIAYSARGLPPALFRQQLAIVANTVSTVTVAAWHEGEDYAVHLFGSYPDHI